MERFRPVTRWGGALLTAALLFGLGAAMFPHTAQAQGPTSTPTAQATQAATDAVTAESLTAEATSMATAETMATRLPPCPLPAGMSLPTATVTATEATLEATAAATDTASAAETAAATEAPLFEPGYLGIVGEDADACGVTVTEIIPDSPAAEAGLAVGDVITGVGFTAYPGLNALRTFITEQPVGAELELVVRRAGEELLVPVTLGTRPEVIPPTVPITPTTTG